MDAFIASRRRPPGYALARATSGALILSALFALVTAAQAFLGARAEGASMDAVALHSAVPLTFYFTWATAALGFTGTILTVGMSDYRPRWLWRVLLGAAIFWLFLFPFGTLIGVATILILLSTRARFSGDEPPTVRPPN